MMMPVSLAQNIEHVNKFEVGCLSRIVALRRRLVEGKKYTLTWTVDTRYEADARHRSLELVKKYREFARFRVDGVLASYYVCYTYHELMLYFDHKRIGEEYLL